MADNIEIRLDQLTEAIKGLYAKSSTSQGEIYNALTSLSQRYENLTSISSEKIATTLVNEFRKTIDVKYGQTNQYIKELESALKSFIASHSNQNPKMSAEITKLVTDVSNAYAKLNSQDLALQKIFNVVETQKNNNTSLEMAKLSDNFLNFSRNFENITITLNKNFADFLEQVRQNSSKEEIKSFQGELDVISGNINSVISAISIIDTKYKDLTGLISVIQKKENAFDDALKEVKSFSNLINEIKEKVVSIDSNKSLDTYSSEIKSKIDDIKYEIQQIAASSSSMDIKTDVFNLTTNINSVSNNVQNLSVDVVNAKDELKNLSTNLMSLGGEVKDVRNLINDEILYKSHQYQKDYEKYLNSAKEDIKVLLKGLMQFRSDIEAINKGNVKILQEPIINAMEELKSKDVGKDIKELSDNLRDVTLEIQSSIQNMQTNLNDLNSVSSMQILTQISEAIPAISDKLEIFRTHVVSENSMNLSEIKSNFSQTMQTFRETLQNTAAKIEDDTKTINIETLDTLKVDLQKLSDHLIDCIEAINEKIQKEFVNFKTDFQEFTIKQEDNIEKVYDKLSSLELGLESFSSETIEKITDNLDAANAKAQDSLSEIKSDILESVINVEKTNKTSLSQFEIKIDKLLNSYMGADLDSINEKKSLRETVVDIETKIDRTNLQQIHNAKELLEEIQSSASDISLKIAALDEAKNTATVMNTLSKIIERIQGIEEGNDELSDELQVLKDDIEQRLKENVQKISALVDKTKEATVFEGENSNFDELFAKVSEYLSNFEYLKSNISQEIKENLASEFVKIDNSIKKIKSQDENSSYSYCLEDVESDLAKIRVAIEKNIHSADDIKLLFEKVIELRTVGLENVKVNRDMENEIGNLSGWLRDTNSKIDDLSQNVEDVQKNALAEIRSQLIQSEKSKRNSSEFYTKIENVLKHLVKTSQNADLKIAELQKKVELILQAQNDSFNPAQFIDIFYENMTQTKMLSNRVEIIEDKINSIQSAVERLISYVEQ